MAANPFGIIAFAALAGFVLSRSREDEDEAENESISGGPDAPEPCAPIEGVPGYGWGTDEANCRNCEYRESKDGSNYCALYQVRVGGMCTCDSWEAAG